MSHSYPGFKMEASGEAGYEGEGRDALVASLPGTPPGNPPISADANVDDWSRAISENGEYIIFATAEKLQANDVNNAVDVYEWRHGTVSMVSDGRDPEGAFRNAIALSSSGSDAFFTTDSALVGQDADVLRDVYDARMNRCLDPEGKPLGLPEAGEEAADCTNAGGKVQLAGFRKPATPPSCSQDACQGTPSPPETFAPAASSVFTGGQNLTPALVSVAPSKEAAPKRLTRAQQLAKALKACKGKPKRKRAACEAQARRRYGGKATAKRKAKKRKTERRRA